MSYAAPKIFTKDEATAAQRTFMFHLTLTADGADATGKTLAGADVRISKAGAALGNAAGAVTELADGWYKCVLAAADVDTLGALAVDISESGCDDVHVEHQVTALDMNVATVSPGADGITAATIATDAIGAAEVAAGAVTKIQSGLATAAQVAAITLATRTTTVSLGTLEADGSTPGISILDALDATVTVTGTFDSSTVTVEVCEDPKADPAVWTAYDDAAGPNPLTSNGSVVVTGAHSAVRATMSNDGASSDVAVTVAIRKPAGA